MQFILDLMLQMSYAYEDYNSVYKLYIKHSSVCSTTVQIFDVFKINETTTCSVQSQAWYVKSFTFFFTF